LRGPAPVARPGAVGQVRGPRAGRDHRAARSSVVPRGPVPSRAQVAPPRAASSVHRLRARRARTPPRAPRPRRLRAGGRVRSAGGRGRGGHAGGERAARMKRFTIGTAEAGTSRLLVIAGPCVIESAELGLEVAARLKTLCAARSLPFVFKASYRKANRSSPRSF